jgi:putative transposase
MTYDPAVHHRRSIRLPGYDYSTPGAYFVTICTHHREYLFGEIVTSPSVGAGSEPAPTNIIPTDIAPINDTPVNHVPANIDRTEITTMRLNDYGKIIQFTWDDLVNHIAGIELGPFVVMPNHVHGVIKIIGYTKLIGLPEIVRQFKTFSARRINEERQTPGVPVWQRNYYEHIIRSETTYNQIVAYVANNPAKWQLDQLFSGENHDLLRI